MSKFFSFRIMETISAQPKMCEHCGYRTTHSGRLKRHVRAVHLKAENCHCKDCGARFSTSYHLKRHVNTKHKGVRYNCDQCDYKATQLGHLKTHIRVVHLKIKNYSCEECDYKAHQLKDLKIHIKAVHLKTNSYPCKECDAAFSIPSNLKIHVDAWHKGVMYSCDQCEFRTSWKQSLTNHKKSIHEKSSLSEEVQDTQAEESIKVENEECKGAHFNKKNIVCGNCDAKIAQSSSLKTDVDASNHCVNCASDLSNLRKHIKTKHQKEKYAGVKDPLQVSSDDDFKDIDVGTSSRTAKDEIHMIKEETVSSEEDVHVWAVSGIQ